MSFKLVSFFTFINLKSRVNNGAMLLALLICGKRDVITRNFLPTCFDACYTQDTYQSCS